MIRKAAPLLLTLLAGCSSYNGVTTRGDDVYIAGTTWVLGFASGWVMHCRTVDAAGRPIAGDEMYCTKPNLRTTPPPATVAPAVVAAPATAAPTAAPAFARPLLDSDIAGGPVVGDTTVKVLYAPSCPDYQWLVSSKRDRAVLISSVSAAIEGGYSWAAGCTPPGR